VARRDVGKITEGWSGATDRPSYGILHRRWLIVGRPGKAPGHGDDGDPRTTDREEAGT
jgi:hypothetical protein